METRELFRVLACIGRCATMVYLTGGLLLRADHCNAQDKVQRVEAAAVSQPSRRGANLSLEQKIGQLFLIRIYADEAARGENRARMTDLIRRYHIGSVDLGARMNGPNLQKATPEQVASLLNSLQANSDTPLLVGADLERGLASRVSNTPELPMPMAFGALPDALAAAEQEGIAVATEARAIGINWAFAPDADVNSDPANPIIGIRSFGSDPERVGELVGAFVKGAHRASLIVTAKHFPGEGDTSSDPHVRSTVINASREHLNSTELVPFRAAIAAGVDAVMPAQAVVSALSTPNGEIATVSKPVLSGLLRTDLGFKGLIVTDALEMRGLTSTYAGTGNPSGRIAVDAIKAGADVLMLPRDLEGAYDGVLAAVRSGEISEARLDESVQRILSVKARLGLFTSSQVDESKISDVMSSPAPYQLAQGIADNAITLVRKESDVLPLRTSQPSAPTEAGQHVVVVSFTDAHDSPLSRSFEEEMKRRNPLTQFFHYYNDQYGSDADLAMPAIQQADAVVLVAYVSHLMPQELARRGRVMSTVGFAGAGAQVFDGLLDVAPERTITIAMGTPYLIESFPSIKNYICTYSLASTSEVSAVKALFGEIHNGATLPVDLPGVAQRGTAIPWPSAQAREHSPH